VRAQEAALGPNPVGPWTQDWTEGEILLAEGQIGQAREAFARGEPVDEVPFTNSQQGLLGALLLNNPPSRDWQARVLVAQQDLTGAIEVYRRINSPDSSRKLTALYDPLYLLEAARLFDRMGRRWRASSSTWRRNRDAARRDYEAFLELWREADPDRPEKREAERYLAGTTG
jgi:tetratricopeptide (TPR) repeat protein